MIHMAHKGDNRSTADSEILLHLLRGDDHLRNTARAIQVPHMTVLRRLAVLEKENVLDHQTEGRNKVFFLKTGLRAQHFICTAERYKLLKLLKKYPELGVIIEDILASTEERMIILFGSYAKFAAKPGSDIDVYMETGGTRAKREIEAVHSKIAVKIGPFDYSSPLIREIIKDHVILRGVEDFYEKTKPGGKVL